MTKPKLEMDVVDTAQQRQIDGLIYGFGLVSILTILWCSCLTFAILQK